MQTTPTGCDKGQLEVLGLNSLDYTFTVTTISGLLSYNPNYLRHIDVKGRLKGDHLVSWLHQTLRETGGKRRQK